MKYTEPEKYKEFHGVYSIACMGSFQIFSQKVVCNQSN